MRTSDTMLTKTLEMYLESVQPYRSQELGSGRAPYFRLLAEIGFLRGALDHSAGAPARQVAGHLHQGLKEMRVAIELGHVVDVWERWDFFLYALAVADRNTAYFIGTLPERCCEPPGQALQWLRAQFRTAFALFQQDDVEAALGLSELKTLVFEDPLPSGLAKDAQEIRNTFQLLETLLRKDGTGFNRAIAERMEILGNSKRGDIMSALDLHGLGLIWVARDRGVEVTVRHDLLPQELPNEGPKSQTSAAGR